MRTKMKVVLLAGIVMFVLGNGYSLAAMSDPNGGWQMRPQAGWAGGIIGIIQHRLDLTSEQQSQIKTILAADSNQINAAQKAVVTAHQALEAAVYADANQATILSDANTLGTAIGNEAVLRAARLSTVKGVLTTDQITKLDAIVAKMKTDGGHFPYGNSMPGAMPPSAPHEE